MSFRKPQSSLENGVGENNYANYIAQVIDASPLSGERSTFSTFASCLNGEIEVAFNHTKNGLYPDWSAYGFNLSLQTWFAP